MKSGLADFIEQRAEIIVEEAITFARSVDAGLSLGDPELRDHLPQILAAIVADLRTTQSRAQEIEKSEGRAPVDAGAARSAAATHALHRAHSGFSISELVASTGPCARPCCARGRRHRQSFQRCRKKSRASTRRSTRPSPSP